MVNDTIVNAKNFSDRLCNEVILWSNDFARDLGVTYGELWAGDNHLRSIYDCVLQRYAIACIILSQKKEDY